MGASPEALPGLLGHMYMLKAGLLEAKKYAYECTRPSSRFYTFGEKEGRLKAKPFL